MIGPANGLLVLGYRGTLEPLGPQQNAVEFSPALEELLQPWLESAQRELVAGAAGAIRFQSESIPLDGLLILLKHQLAGICTHAAAEEQPAGVMARFPALLPLVRSTVAEWINASATFLARLQQDAVFLANALGVPRLAPVRSATGTGSDVHAGAHPVLRIAFADGTCVYLKPRRVTGEWLWHALLAHMESCVPELRLPRARVFTPDPRLRYGWLEPLAYEWREPLVAQMPEQGSAYWQAAGATVCIAQHMHLTDLHMGNVVATSLGPAVTDAECLATPEIPRAANGDDEIEHAVTTILATGLLPRILSNSQPDISGLFGRAAPVRGVTLPRWTNTADGYRLKPCAAALVAQPNTAQHHPAAPHAHAAMTPLAALPQLLAGYRSAAEALMRTRGAITQPGASWRRVLERVHAPRVILRDTLTYGRLLSESLLPQHLRSVERRRSALLASLRADQPSHTAAMMRREARALASGHVPRFIQSPGTRHLGDTSGRILVRGFAVRPAADSLLMELDRLSPARLEQVLIPALLTSLW